MSSQHRSSSRRSIAGPGSGRSRLSTRRKREEAAAALEAEESSRRSPSPPPAPTTSSGKYRPNRTSRAKPLSEASRSLSSESLGYKTDRSVYDTIPPDYRVNPETTDPILHYLPKALEQGRDVSLKELLQASDLDVRLHRARVQASLEKDTRLIRTYQLQTDPSYQERQARLESRKMELEELEENSAAIRQELIDTPGTKGVTQAELAELQLERWQRSLELYVNNIDTPDDANWQGLLESLLAGFGEDQDLSGILQQAAVMCEELKRKSRQAVEDCSQRVYEVETEYMCRLEAHQLFSRSCLTQVGEIEDSFQTSGKKALQIGHQLEHAEWKRSQCESASALIRRWWLLESLAEQEAQTAEPIPVEQEVRGLVPPEQCVMDSLFIEPENSLEAAKVLQALRQVVRARSGDHSNARRFELTVDIVQRTSDSLEQRLLNSFSRVYSAGGIYDFSAKPRPGSIDWRELNALAQALLLFDSGRSLHKRYVDMVVTSRFPELFNVQMKEGLNDSMDGDETVFDIDATRSQLSSLFHRVSDVCTAEFELIAHVFTEKQDNEEMPLVVARALLQRVVSDPEHGLQARINDVLENIDRTGDFDAGAKKLDTFVVIQEKAAGLFSLLRDAADLMDVREGPKTSISEKETAVESLKGFLTSQELSLSNSHRQGYINLELRLLHHDCCNSLDQAGCTLVKTPAQDPDTTLAEKGIMEEYRAPLLPLHKESLVKLGYNGILAGPLKQSVVRQSLINATDSLARARLMFGSTKRGESMARVILQIYTQMCNFYGECYLYPIMETLCDILPSDAPSQAPQLPYSEEEEAPDLGVSPAFWVALERLHSAAKSFDRELWAEDREDSHRVWEILSNTEDETSVAIAKNLRMHFYGQLEHRGEQAILRALDTLSTHIQWVIVNGGESMLATGGTRIFNQLTGQSGGPYAIPSGSSLDTPNSPAVKSLTYCLRVQFVHVQAALTPSSLNGFWTALSMRLYDILVARLLQHYYISTVGAVILSRDVEALRSVAMLAGTDHQHWDVLRELLTLYMTPPDAIKNMLIGPDGDASKGLFARAGRERCLVFLSRRNDYRYKTAAGLKKSGWVAEMLAELNLTDPSDSPINIGAFAAGRRN